MNKTNFIEILHNITKGIFISIGIFLGLSIIGVLYVYASGLTASTGETLTARKWNNLVDSIKDIYLTDGTEILTNKVYNGKPVYRRTYTGINPTATTYMLLGTIPNITPIGTWSIDSSGGYRFGNFSHADFSINYRYTPSDGKLENYQKGWDNSTWTNTSFTIEYTKN